MEQTEKVPLRPWPDFAEKGVIYQLFLRAFTLDGTLKAAEKMLPHLAELGIDIVYLCPPVVADDDMNEDHWSERQKKSGIKNPKNPYRLKDYFHVDPEYGTDQDLKDFVRRAHDLGMKTLLDLVYYHCGPTAVFLEEHPNATNRYSASSVRYSLNLTSFSLMSSYLALSFLFWISASRFSRMDFKLMNSSSVTTATNISVESALIFGLMPRRALE